MNHFKNNRLVLKNLKQTENFAAQVASYTKSVYQNKKSCVIFLEGNLASGKTTFSKYFINHFYPEQIVTSPTYNLVNSYFNEAVDIPIAHFDLYRLADASELDYLDYRDYLSNNICLIEWASLAYNSLPDYDLKLEFFVGEDVKNREVKIDEK